MMKIVEDIKGNIHFDSNKGFMENVMENASHSYFIRFLYLSVWFFFLAMILSGVYLILLHSVYKGNHDFERIFYNEYFIQTFPFISWSYGIIATLPLIISNGDKTYFTGLEWWGKLLGAIIEYEFVFLTAAASSAAIMFLTGSYIAQISIGCIFLPFVFGCIRRRPPESPNS